MAKIMNENVKRINVTVGLELKEWYEKRAREIGIPYTSYMATILYNHMLDEEKRKEKRT